jgi:hypothetical protein
MVKVLGSLVASMTVGAAVLLVFERRPVPAGAFSLASYTSLKSVEQVAAGGIIPSYGRWESVEVFYSNTAAGNIRQLAALEGLASAEDVNFHFLVCNGRGGADGQIQPSDRWQRQRPCIPDGLWDGSGRSIRICVVGDTGNRPATDCQAKRTAELIEQICRKFSIGPQGVSYPQGWQL